MEKNTFYITTPIYYPSNKMTLGNCYSTIIADCIARFNKMLGKDVFYLTGTDEHGEKLAKTAEAKGMEIKNYLDVMIEDIKDLWKLLDIDYSKFIRTTDTYHEKVAQKVFNELYKKGYIYKSKYKGLYCLPCESFWTESQLVDGRCPDCGREVKYEEEEAYFFKLSEFGDKLLKLYEENPEFLQPNSRVHEMVNNFIKPGLQDLCVSRTSVKWGIPVEFDPKHTIYVWIDALFNYLSAIGYASDDETNYKKYWPADLHLIGKDIVRFHSIYWPALLMALDVPLPKQIYGHGWLLLGGQKLSKSKNSLVKEIIDPRILVSRYSVDSVRYYLIREIPFGSDGTYSTENFLKRINTDLCNDFGNLVKRTLTMAQKYFGSIVPKQADLNNDDIELIKNVETAKNNVLEYMKKFDVSKAITELFSIFGFGNKYIDQTMPWNLAKDNDTRLKTVIYNLLETIKIGTVLLQSFLPQGAKKVLNAFGIDEVNIIQIAKFGLLKDGAKIGEVEMLYPRLDIEKELKELALLD
ncbi:MAG: methionine--tRNA ligase [Clostridia bacterium]|nr:methionine--tRNA ligase [Clostridia bacterium]